MKIIFLRLLDAIKRRFFQKWDFLEVIMRVASPPWFLLDFSGKWFSDQTLSFSHAFAPLIDVF